MRRMGNQRSFIASLPMRLAFVLVLLLAACSPNPSVPTATMPLPSSTVAKTVKPTSTVSLPPTATPTPILVSPTATLTPTATPGVVIHFAVIGDFGQAGIQEKEVSDLVHSWNPDFILTVGDDNYPDGAADTIDQNIGYYYHDFIYPYKGIYGPGSTTNRFFPTLGNHDWVTANAQPYLDYFTLPGNERFYNFVWGPVEFFVIDSDYHDPSGITATSPQAKWLESVLASSISPWKIVYFHLPPYSSGSVHGSTPELQWPFQQWGATAVLTGHDHEYERIIVDGFPYFVDGLGGNGKYTFNSTPVAGSQVRYNGDVGAMLVTASAGSIDFQFINVNGEVIDQYTIDK